MIKHIGLQRPVPSNWIVTVRTAAGEETSGPASGFMWGRCVEPKYQITEYRVVVESPDVPCNCAPGVCWGSARVPVGMTCQFPSTAPSDSKPTNPKDAIGSGKLPLHLVPASLTVYAAMAFAEGASKYGAHNWRVAGVRASIYLAAHERHMSRWWNGEDSDPVTLVPHLASAAACLAILIDAKACGMLNDDRPPAADMAELIRSSEAVVQWVVALNAEVAPRHYTIADSAT